MAAYGWKRHCSGHLALRIISRSKWRRSTLRGSYFLNRFEGSSAPFPTADKVGRPMQSGPGSAFLLRFDLAPQVATVAFFDRTCMPLAAPSSTKRRCRNFALVINNGGDCWSRGADIYVADFGFGRCMTPAKGD